MNKKRKNPFLDDMEVEGIMSQRSRRGRYSRSKVIRKSRYKKKRTSYRLMG